MILTAQDAGPGSHVWYGNMVAPDVSEAGAEFRDRCENAYAQLAPWLDANFVKRFRTTTPDAVSEMFFALALQHSGWTLTQDRARRFDFAFTRPDHPGRLLVEVVTPSVTDWTAWEESEFGDGGVIRSFDERSRDAAMLRLSSALHDKAKVIGESIALGDVRPDDYRVVAISGVRLSQEMHLSLSAGGMPPDYARAFLPIGPMAVSVTVPKDYSRPPEFGEAHHVQSDTMTKTTGAQVQRAAFATDAYPHVDAVMFSPVSIAGFEHPAAQTTALHNPYSDYSGPVVRTGLAADYRLAICDTHLTLSIDKSG